MTVEKCCLVLGRPETHKHFFMLIVCLVFSRQILPSNSNIQLLLSSFSASNFPQSFRVTSFCIVLDGGNDNGTLFPILKEMPLPFQNDSVHYLFLA